jgi:hypothetical protein
MTSLPILDKSSSKKDAAFYGKFFRITVKGRVDGVRGDG